MPSAKNGKFQYEAGQTATSMSALTDSGDAKTFNSAASLWSLFAGFEPVVRPNGVISGCIVSATTTNNQVSISAGTVNIDGAIITVAAQTLVLTRGVTVFFKKCSIIVDATGTVDETEGTEHTAHADGRGVNGGPAYIAVGDVELGQVHFSTETAAVVAASEIKVLLNTHREDANSPALTELYESGDIAFTDALMLNHTGDIPKAVHASFAEPVFSEQREAYDYVPIEETFQNSSTPVYDGTSGSESSSLSQGGFSTFLRNGVTDPIISVKSQIVWTKFFPVRTRTEHMLGQARLGISRTYPAGSNIAATCTLTGDRKFTEQVS